LREEGDQREDKKGGLTVLRGASALARQLGKRGQVTVLREGDVTSRHRTMIRKPQTGKRDERREKG